MSVSVINRLRMVLHELESTALFLSSGLFSCCRAFDFIVSPYETNNKPYVSEEGGILCVRARICINNEQRRGGGGGEDPVENRAVRELPERAAAGGPAAVPGAAGQHLHGAG
jgi:hypothetical protein